MQSPYQILGEEGIRNLAREFYQAMDELPEASSIRAMHGHSLEDITDKLGDYLIGWMGGPPVYYEKKGTVCLTDQHKPYRIGPDERDQWLLCFNKALERIDVTDELKEMLHEPIFRVAQAVQNRDESLPDNPDPNIIGSDR